MVHLIITGVTGLAGSEALRQALPLSCVSHVTVLSRRPLPAYLEPYPPNPKLTVLELADFLHYPPAVLDHLKNADGVLWFLGISGIAAKKQTEREQEVITLDYAVAAAKAFAQIERDPARERFVFAFVTGAVVTQIETKGWSTLARFKGKAEKVLAELRSLPTFTSYSFRPGLISPVTPSPDSKFGPRVLPWIFPVVGTVFPGAFIKSDVLARGMIAAVVQGASGAIPGWPGKGEPGDENAFTNLDIQKLAASLEV